MGLSTETANLWVERWERQQQRYAIDREERFTVIADVVEHVTHDHAGRPLIVDLGCGPGCLAARLADRLPDAEIVGVDMDPLLLELARARHPGAVRYVEGVIGGPGWVETLGLDRPLDAAVSTTALHYFPPEDLRTLYAQLAEVIRPGGVLVNGDHLAPDAAAPAAIAAHVGRRRAERQNAFTYEEWSAWWDAVPTDPELAALLAEQQRHQAEPPRRDNNDLPLSWHVELLRKAGFAHAGPVWQFGTSYVLVAVR
jgi:SAM-dependent methyltransferase